MAIHKIVYIPDPVLHKKAQLVDNLDDPALQTLIDDMFETMYHVRGVGLAAPQIGISKRLSVIDVTEDKSEHWVLINPEIVTKEGSEVKEEACLSVPGAYGPVNRATKVTLRALDRYGKPYEIKAEGLLAHCIQHEVEHLDGTVYVDHLSALRRQRVRKKVEKYLRLQR